MLLRVSFLESLKEEMCMASQMYEYILRFGIPKKKVSIIKNSFHHCFKSFWWDKKMWCGAEYPLKMPWFFLACKYRAFGEEFQNLHPKNLPIQSTYTSIYQV